MPKTQKLGQWQVVFSGQVCVMLAVLLIIKRACYRRPLARWNILKIRNNFQKSLNDNAVRLLIRGTTVDLSNESISVELVQQMTAHFVLRKEVKKEDAEWERKSKKRRPKNQTQNPNLLKNAVKTTYLHKKHLKFNNFIAILK